MANEKTPIAQNAVKTDKNEVQLISLSNIHLRYDKDFEDDGTTRKVDDKGRPAHKLIKVALGELFSASEKDASGFIAQGAAREASVREVNNGGVLSAEQFETELVKTQNSVRDTVNANPEAASSNAKALPSQDTVVDKA